jgi:hypothetical protein
MVEGPERLPRRWQEVEGSKLALSDIVYSPRVAEALDACATASASEHGGTSGGEGGS